MTFLPFNSKLPKGGTVLLTLVFPLLSTLLKNSINFLNAQTDYLFFPAK